MFALTTAVWVQPKLLPGPAAPNDQYPLMWASWTRIKHFQNSESSRDTEAFCYHFELAYARVYGDRRNTVA